MLQALIHRKLGGAISKGYFDPSEDSKTSSSFGVLQYLPDDMLLHVIDGACGIRSCIPKDTGHIVSVSFWPHFSAEGTNNSFLVEPDVWIECEKYHILIEVKKSDSAFGYAQSIEQWQKEIKGLKNETEDEKKIILIALGGNENLRDSRVIVDGEEFDIFTASWFNLLDSVTSLRNELSSNEHPQAIRILDDCIKALSEHGCFNMVWFVDLPADHISNNSTYCLRHDWDFDNFSILGKLNNNRKVFSKLDIRDIWKIK